VGAQRVGGSWLSVGKLVELFTAMGCVLHDLPGRLIQPGKSYKVRYLYSPVTGDFVSLGGLADDDIMPPSEIENWERRLGIDIPKGLH
jgi:hypothetical protein